MPHLLKHQQSFTILLVLENGSISASHGHIAALAFTEVVETFFVIPEVVVPVGNTRRAGKNDYIRRVCRSTNAALPLTTEKTVDLIATVVERPHLKRDRLSH